ncbi:MAG TPA: CocE/NonD family hydrolase [Candidatus Angelobacter sp.]|nr:CocE/NonD family hydrolase [Candidatus Angelobacter sp.]
MFAVRARLLFLSILPGLAGIWFCLGRAGGVPSGIQANNTSPSSFAYQDLRIPMPEAGEEGLHAFLVRPNGAGPHPLVLINHGTPRDPAERRTFLPQRMLPMAMEFARRGWAAVILIRRGYGDSGGPFAEDNGRCSHPDYTRSAEEAVRDFHAALAFLSQRPEIDSHRVLAVGVSAGGFATVALTANPPPGLLAAISFAGGTGSAAKDMVCRPNLLVESFRHFGKNSRVPMLWVYSANDHYFSPFMAQRLHEAFTEAGGRAEFIVAPPFGDDGHLLFNFDGIPVWTGYVDRFLKNQGLTLRTELLPLPLPKIALPPELSEDGKRAFEKYLTLPAFKAFALSPEGAYGYQYEGRTLEEAKAAALDWCQQNAYNHECRIAMVNDSPVEQKVSQSVKPPRTGAPQNPGYMGQNRAISPFAKIE